MTPFQAFISGPDAVRSANHRLGRDRTSHSQLFSTPHYNYQQIIYPVNSSRKPINSAPFSYQITPYPRRSAQQITRQSRGSQLVTLNEKPQPLPHRAADVLQNQAPFPVTRPSINRSSKRLYANSHRKYAQFPSSQLPRHLHTISPEVRKVQGTLHHLPQIPHETLPVNEVPQNEGRTPENQIKQRKYAGSHCKPQQNPFPERIQRQ